MTARDAGTMTELPANAPGWKWSALVPGWLFGGSAGRSPGDKAQSGPVSRFRNLCISREAGAGGGTIARLVGTRMGWKVYDHELLEAIAQGMKVSTEEARAFDELAPSLVQDWLLPLREEHYAPQEAYLDHLAKLVESIGKAGESILVGRGAAHLLKRSETLSIRIIAPLKERARKLAESMGVSVRTARRAAIDLDRRSARFVRTLHRVDVADPHLYDLVLDSHSLGLTIATEVIVKAIQVGNPAKTLGS